MYVKQIVLFCLMACIIFYGCNNSPIIAEINIQQINIGSLKKVNEEIINYAYSDFDGDGKKDLLLLFSKDADYESGIYGFYKEHNGKWVLIHYFEENITTHYSTEPFRTIDLDGKNGDEIIVNADIASYSEMRFIKINDNKIDMLGEISFPFLLDCTDYDNRYYIMKPYVNQDCFVINDVIISGEFETHECYFINDHGELELLKQMPEYIINKLYNKKLDSFVEDGDLFLLQSLFWFAYKYSREKIDQNWIDEYSKYIKIKEGYKSNATIIDDVLQVMGKRLILNDKDFEDYLNQSGIELCYWYCFR